jgi:hypothetical protein
MHSSRAPHARVRAAAIAALVTGVVVGLGACTTGGATAGPATSQAGGGAPGGTTGATPAPGATDGTGAGADPAPHATTGGSTDKDAQPVQETDPASEIVPTATPTPYRLPGLTSSTAKKPAPLVAKAPRSASTHGRLVAGFPRSAVPLPRSLTIVSSSVASQGRHLQVTAQASSDASPKVVRRQLTNAFTERGYTAAKAVAAPGSSAVQYRHGTDGVVITFHQRLGGGTELTLSGSFTTAS